VNKAGFRLQASGFGKSKSSEEGPEKKSEIEIPKPKGGSPKPEARFPKQRRLLRHADFERVYKQGRRHFAAHITVFYLQRSPDDTAPQGLRVGFTVGRVLGRAVQRNRMKRRLREAVRLSGFPPEVSADVVINPKRSLLGADFADVRSEVAKAFQVIEKAAKSL
jgi:ribonuclease P protein component